MTREDKELLLKDIYARIPYGVKGCCEDETFCTTPPHWYAENTLEYSVNYMVIKNGWRPYLFPLSSMTDEQYNEIWNCMAADNRETLKRAQSGQKAANPYCNVMDFYNKCHFDYRGLIEKGLAIDATGKNIY